MDIKPNTEIISLELPDFDNLLDTAVTNSDDEQFDAFFVLFGNIEIPRFVYYAKNNSAKELIEFKKSVYNTIEQKGIAIIYAKTTDGLSKSTTLFAVTMY